MIWRPGHAVVHRAQPSWGVGRVLAVQADPPRLKVAFPGRPEGPAWISSKDPAVARHQFAPGDPVLVKGARGKVLRRLPGRGARLLYEVEIDGSPAVVSEDGLSAPAPHPGPERMLADCRWQPQALFELRDRTVRLDLMLRADALGALCSSRVMVLPYQVSVAQRVLSASVPRFVLADEVGLGKTIEAGLVLSALRHAGLARRALVVAPAHLCVQWLAEMFHKFNLMFTWMDLARYEGALEDDPERSPWHRFPLVVTSLEWLAKDPRHLGEAADPQAGWDLVIFDEAHHLRAAESAKVAQALSRVTWGLLALTATPLQLDPGEFHALLRLVDPAPAASEEEFEERLSHQGDLSSEVRALLGGDDQAFARIAALFPGDGRLLALAQARDPALLDHLAESYGLSTRLVRNRRAVVGTFTERRLHRHPVELGEAERAVMAEARVALGKDMPAGAALASLLRGVDSSPVALAWALESKGEKKLAARARALGGGAKYAAFRALCREIRAGEPGAKILVFAEQRATLDDLVLRLRQERIEALSYHGGLSTLERDRQIARFRDPDGPWLLISTEIGGEGRNFQFCHHLVHYDLAWSPAAIEQRVGRLDRVGQRRPVEIHVFRAEGTLGARVLDLMDRAVRVFAETVGGLDPVLESVEEEVARLAREHDPADPAWDGYAAALEERVARARAESARAQDPLLDLRSFDQPAVSELCRRGEERLGAASGARRPLGERLAALAAHVERELEEVVGGLAREVGIVLDREVDVLPGQCALTLGHQMRVDALPGVDLSEERAVLGTFRREVAVVQDEIDFFAPGHPLLEGLFGWARDGELGRATVTKSALRQTQGAALEAHYLVLPPEPEDLAPGARVPSRQAARYLLEPRFPVTALLDSFGRGVSVETPIMVSPLRAVSVETPIMVSPLRGVDVPAGSPVPESWRSVVEAAVDSAGAPAMARLEQQIAQAVARAEADRAAAVGRLGRWLARPALKLSPARQRALLEAEDAAWRRVLEALRRCRAELDAAALRLLA